MFLMGFCEGWPLCLSLPKSLQANFCRILAFHTCLWNNRRHWYSSRLPSLPLRYKSLFPSKARSSDGYRSHRWRIWRCCHPFALRIPHSEDWLRLDYSSPRLHLHRALRYPYYPREISSPSLLHTKSSSRSPHLEGPCLRVYCNWYLPHGMGLSHTSYIHLKLCPSRRLLHLVIIYHSHTHQRWFNFRKIPPRFLL